MSIHDDHDLAERQRHQLDRAHDCLVDAASHLTALIESEPEGTRELLMLRRDVEMLTAILERRFASAPPAPATTRAAASTGATDGEAA